MRDAQREPEPLFVTPQGFLPNATFFGRQKELKTLHDFLSKPKRRQGIASCVLINGQTGSGKTHLARQYVWEYRSDYPGGIFWVDATSHQSVLTSIEDITRSILQENHAKATKWNKANDLDSKNPVVFRECLSTRDEWLLVFDGLTFVDNDKELSDFSQFLIPEKRCSIIYTSADETLRRTKRIWEPWPHFLEMLPLQIEDACKLLFRDLDILRPTPVQRAKAEEIAIYYECLPQAMHLAGLKIHATGEPLEKFQFDEHRSNREVVKLFLRHSKNNGVPNLLNLISFFDHQIPVLLIELGISSLADQRINLLTRTLTGKGGSIDKSLEILVNHGLVGTTRNPMAASPPNAITKSRSSFDRSRWSTRPDRPTLVERDGRIFRGIRKNSPEKLETPRRFSTSPDEQRSNERNDSEEPNPSIDTKIITVEKDTQTFCRDEMRAMDKKRDGSSHRGDAVGIYDIWLVCATKLLCKSFENLWRQAAPEEIVTVVYPWYIPNARALAGNFPEKISSAPAVVKEAHGNLNLLMHYIDLLNQGKEMQDGGPIFLWLEEPSSPEVSPLDIKGEAVPSAVNRNWTASPASNVSQKGKILVRPTRRSDLIYRLHGKIRF